MCRSFSGSCLARANSVEILDRLRYFDTESPSSISCTIVTHKLKILLSLLVIDRAASFSRAGTLLAILFCEREREKMKCMHFLVSTVLVTVTAVWIRAAAQGLDQALASIAVEAVLKTLKARTTVLPNIISSFRLTTMTFERKISER